MSLALLPPPKPLRRTRSAVGWHVLEGIPALAWNQDALAQEAANNHTASGEWSRVRERASVSSSPPAPIVVLVVGSSDLVEALQRGDGTPPTTILETEQTPQTKGALDLIRSLAPDVLLLDVDLPGAESLARQLAAEPAPQKLAIVAVGLFSTPDAALRWSSWGVNKVLVRPVSSAVIQRTCLELAAASQPPERAEPLGEITVDELGTQLAEELRRGLSDAVQESSRSVRVRLADGHDVRAALWAAVARVRDIVTMRSGGSIRFADTGPEGAVPFAPFSLDMRQPRARGTLGALQEDDQLRLDGRSLVIADDDPGVRWFLAGVFRAAGATVYEAADGEAAFTLACQVCPDLVVSDVLMPKLDGFRLCRMLKHDIALRDVPVVLLSWKEDLLQRVRELGVGADGYVRKEAHASVVLARVHEVMRARQGMENRMPGTSELRGRLDGVTVRTILALAAKYRPNAQVSIRDASFLYEIEVRDGVPCKASRTTTEGHFERGPRVLAGALGVGAGRFLITPSTGKVHGELRGTLVTQLRPPIARARAAQRLLADSALLHIKRLGIDIDAMETYLQATPEPMRAYALRLAEGVSPRALVLRGEVSVPVLERVVEDIIVHGGLTAIIGTFDEDLLPAAVEREMRILEGGLLLSNHSQEFESAAQSRSTEPWSDEASLTPSPLSHLPSLLPMSTGAAGSAGTTEATVYVPPSPPPRPMLPTPFLAIEEPTLRFSYNDFDFEEPPVHVNRAGSSVLTSLGMIPEAERSTELPPVAPAAQVAFSERSDRENGSDDVSPAPWADVSAEAELSPLPPLPLHRNYLTLTAWAAMLLLGFGLGTWWFRNHSVWPSSTTNRAPQNAPAIGNSEPRAVISAAPSAPPVVPSATPAISPRGTPSMDATNSGNPAGEDLPLPVGTTIPRNYGLLDINASRRDTIIIDRLDMGRGPRLSLPFVAGVHEVRLRHRGEEQPLVVVVRPGRRTLVDLRGTWQRLELLSCC